MSRRLKSVHAGVAGGHDSGSNIFTGSVSGRSARSPAAAVRWRWFGDDPVAFGLGFVLSAASMAFLVYATQTSGERPVPTLALPKFTTDGTSKVVHRQHGALPRERSAGQASAGSATSNERHPAIGDRGLEDFALGISGEVKKDLPEYAIRKAFVGFAGAITDFG